MSSNNFIYFLFLTLSAVTTSVYAANPGLPTQCGMSFDVPITYNWGGSNTYKLTFGCPNNYNCVNKQCQFFNNASKVVNSQTTMCTTGSVIDCTGGINSFCGFSITMEDGFTYYANCPTGYHCNGDICQNNDPAVAQWLYQLAATPIITRCNATGLRVQNGKCQGSCPANLECIDIAM